MSPYSSGTYIIQIVETRRGHYFIVNNDSNINRCCSWPHHPNPAQCTRRDKLNDMSNLPRILARNTSMPKSIEQFCKWWENKRERIASCKCTLFLRVVFFYRTTINNVGKPNSEGNGGIMPNMEGGESLKGSSLLGSPRQFPFLVGWSFLLGYRVQNRQDS